MSRSHPVSVHQIVPGQNLGGLGHFWEKVDFAHFDLLLAIPPLPATPLSGVFPTELGLKVGDRGTCGPPKRSKSDLRASGFKMVGIGALKSQ